MVESSPIISLFLKIIMECCICRGKLGKYGNNAKPVMNGRCCDRCNRDLVIPVRIARMFKEKVKGVIKNG